MIDEQRYRSLIQQLATGGIAGNKTYHQVRDQYMPMDSESMGYMNGGGVGSMMQPRMNFAGGGGDFEPLGYQDESITVEDLTNRNNGNFLISAANALDNQSGTINSAPSITNSGVNTIEGSLIDGDDITSRYDVQKDFKSDRPFDRDFSSFDEARMGAPANSSLGYQDGIMGMVGNDPFAGMNALEKDIAKQAMNTSQTEFDNLATNDFKEMKGINFRDQPINNIFNRQDNTAVGIIDKFRSQQNPDASLVNKTKNVIGSGLGFGKNLALGAFGKIANVPAGIASILGNVFNRDPNAPSYQTYDPTGKIDYSNLNTNNLNDFYDSNPDSETYGTTRFDRAKPGSFASFRTLADYFNRNKNIQDTGKKAAADNKKAAEAKKAQEDIKQAQVERAAYMARAQRTADRRDSGQGNTVTGFGRSGLGRDPNDRM